MGEVVKFPKKPTKRKKAPKSEFYEVIPAVSFYILATSEQDAADRCTAMLEQRLEGMQYAADSGLVKKCPLEFTPA